MLKYGAYRLGWKQFGYLGMVGAFSNAVINPGRKPTPLPPSDTTPTYYYLGF